jgi:hypothetical protein
MIFVSESAVKLRESLRSAMVIKDMQDKILLDRRDPLEKNETNGTARVLSEK